jgi:hypothetical protein
VAGLAIVAVAPADHVAVASAVVALDITGAAGPVAAAILVTDEADPLDALGPPRRDSRGGEAAVSPILKPADNDALQVALGTKALRQPLTMSCNISQFA